MTTFTHFFHLFTALLPRVRAFFTPADSRAVLEAYLGQADNLAQLEHMQRQLERRSGGFGMLVM